MLITREEAWYGLCDKCRNELGLFDGTVPRCDLCGRPLVSETDRCLPCRTGFEAEPPSYDRVMALFPYAVKYIDLLTSFKYKKSLGAGHFLAEQLINAVKMLPVDGETVLVPVPPRPGKIRKTGWDQIVCLSGLMNKMRSKEMQFPPIRPCLKRYASQTQKKLGKKDRKTNLKGRIMAKGKAPRTCIIFDDVITTGSTLNACAAALKSAGAEKVYGICLFYD